MIANFTYLHSLNVKTVPSQTIQFSISTQFSSIWPTARTLSGTTILGQSGPGSDGNEGVLRIPQSSRLFSVISWTHVGEGENTPTASLQLCPTVEKQSVNSATLAN